VVLSQVVYFGKLPFATNNEKFSLKRVNSRNICRRLGGSLLQSKVIKVIRFQRTASTSVPSLSHSNDALVLC